MLATLLRTALIGLALTQAGQGVSVTVPPWVTGGSCVSVASGVRTEVRASAIVLPCGEVGRLRCDLDNAEPLDTDIKAVCASGRIVIQPARQRTVEVEASDATTVEWIEWLEGRPPIVLATRPLSGLATVALARSASRFVRFNRPNQSPITIPESDLPERITSRLPNVGPDGELLMAVALVPVHPKAVRLETASGRALGEFTVDAGGRVRAPSLPAGKLTWRPVYEGGVTGPPGVAAVVAGQSTAIAIPRQDVGQLRVTLDADLCADAKQTRVTTVRRTTVGRGGEIEWARASVDSACRQIFGGLPPGSYEVRADGGGAAVVQALTVGVQHETTVELVAPAVSVAGTVLFNGRPYPRPDLTIKFLRPEDPPDGGVSASIQAGGGYSVRLPAPGRYSVRLAARELPLIGTQRDVVVTVGQNVSDWSVEGGTMKVRVDRWDHSSPVQITFQPVDAKPTGIATASFILQPTDDESFELPGIAFGKYSLQARQVLPDRSTRISTTERTEIRDTGPAPEVTLTLAEYSSEIRLVDTTGQPVLTRAILFSPREGPLIPVAPGFFRVTASQLSAGDPIPVVATGYNATCVLAPPNGGTITVTLQPGTRTMVEVRSSVPYGVIPGHILVPGAACPVALGLLTKERLQPESNPGGDVISRFVVTQLSLERGVLYQGSLTDPPSSLIRNSEGVVVIIRR